jgi:hypothetical protein
MESNLTYKQILDRCKSDVLEYIPDLPKEDTLQAWSLFLVDLWREEDLHEKATESVESWDWSIYTHYGFEILDALPSDEMRQAESSFFDVWGSEPIETLNDPYDMASRIAYFALVNIWQEVAQDCVEELIELAQNQIENMESV